MEALGKLERATSPDPTKKLPSEAPKRDFVVTTSRAKTPLAESHIESKSLRKLENEMMKT